MLLCHILLLLSFSSFDFDIFLILILTSINFCHIFTLTSINLYNILILTVIYYCHVLTLLRTIRPWLNVTVLPWRYQTYLPFVLNSGTNLIKGTSFMHDLEVKLQYTFRLFSSQLSCWTIISSWTELNSWPFLWLWSIAIVVSADISRKRLHLFEIPVVIAACHLTTDFFRANFFPL